MGLITLRTDVLPQTKWLMSMHPSSLTPPFPFVKIISNNSFPVWVKCKINKTFSQIIAFVTVSELGVDG